MRVDEYKRRLIDMITSDRKRHNGILVNEAKVIENLDNIVEMANKLLKQSHEIWNEYDFHFIESQLSLIFKRISYIKKIYDVVNLIKSGKLEENAKNKR